MSWRRQHSQDILCRPRAHKGLPVEGEGTGPAQPTKLTLQGQRRVLQAAHLLTARPPLPLRRSLCILKTRLGPWPPGQAPPRCRQYLA